MREKMTIIKVLGRDGKVTTADLEKWRKIFEEKRMTAAEALVSGEVSIEYLSKPDDENYITFVKVGEENSMPSLKDLESWRDMFKDAIGDPDFKVFTHPHVTIELIPVGKVIAVE